MVISFGLTKMFRKAKRVFKPGAVILMYHQVKETTFDPFGLAVSPKHFRQQLQSLKEQYHPMRLVDLVDGIQKGALPERAVVITFDDGYRNNLTHALPELERQNIPATISVVARQRHDPFEFWWDMLEGILSKIEKKKELFEFCFKGRTHRWALRTEAERVRAYRAMHRLLISIDTKKRKRFMTELRQWSGVDHDATSYMTVDELRHLAASPLIEIGAHTVHHPMLTSLSEEEQSREISEGKERLEHVTGKPVDIFAYPFGDYNAKTRALTKKAGFRAACTTKSGSVEAGDDVFQLRRSTVLDWDREEFTHRLETFFKS